MTVAAGKSAVPRVASDKTSPGDRRERILQVARRRFAAFGYEATTVRQIADDVNLLAGSLYHHFVTKEEMLHEVVRDAVNRLRDRASEVADFGQDPEQRLVSLIVADVREMISNQEVHAILYQERVFFRRNPDFAYVVEARSAHYHVWQAILEDGIRDGLFNPDMTVFLTISTILRMLNTGADWYIHDRAVQDAAGIFSLDELSAFYVNFVLGAVRAPGRAGAPVPWPVPRETPVNR